MSNGGGVQYSATAAPGMMPLVTLRRESTQMNGLVQRLETSWGAWKMERAISGHCLKSTLFSMCMMLWLKFA